MNSYAGELVTEFVKLLLKGGLLSLGLGDVLADQANGGLGASEDNNSP